MKSKKDIAEENYEATAIQVLSKYGVNPEKLTLIQGGTIKTVWKLNAHGNRFCLKRLKQTFDKALFSVNAQIYISNSGGRVPGIILNEENQAITEYKGQLFVLYEWIDGSDLNFALSTDFRKAVQALAAFHIASKGYVPNVQCRVSTKLRKWPDQYNSMKKRMLEWKEISSGADKPPDNQVYPVCSDYPVHAAHTAYQAYTAYLSYVDQIITLADLASKRLSESDYLKLTQEGSPSVVLCHQDFGRGNVLSAAEGTYVLDLDGVTYDLPARDLRKIIGKAFENTGLWSCDTITEILSWYTEINPLSESEKEILYADLTFPHWFFGLVKNLFQNGKQLRASKIERIARFELSKEVILTTLLKRSE